MPVFPESYHLLPLRAFIEEIIEGDHWINQRVDIKEKTGQELMKAAMRIRKEMSYQWWQQLMKVSQR